MISRLRRFLLVAVAALAGAVSPLAGETVKREIDVAFAPIEAVRPVLEKALSPQGKFVMLANKGAVLVIDTPEGIFAAEQALAQADLPVPDIALDFQFVTGIPTRKSSITMAQQVPFPVAFARPTFIVGPNGFVTGVVPATPTKFETRNVGVTSESTSTVNPDGSITIDTRTEASEFEGFIQYGSGVFPAGFVGAVPVPGGAVDPLFFAPFASAAGVSLPILSTTRITTSVVVRPRVQAGVIHLDLMPRLEVAIADSAAEPETIDLKQFHTVLPVRRGELGRVHGFAGADEVFNRHFLGAKDTASGETAILVKAVIRPAADGGGEAEDTGEGEGGTSAPIPEP